MNTTPPPRYSPQPSRIPFADWPPLTPHWEEALRRRLPRLVPPDRLEHMRNCVLGKEPTIREEPQEGVEYGEPRAVNLTKTAERSVVENYRMRGRQLAPHTAFVVAAAGGGTRLAQSVPAADRERLVRAGRMTKPTFPVGPVSGKSPLCLTLEALTRLRLQEGIDRFPVWVVVSSETRKAVEQDLERNERRLSLPDLVLLDQAENPTFDCKGRLLVTWDPGAEAPRLVTSAGGTFGVLRTLQECQAGLNTDAGATPLAVAEAWGVTRFVVLYGDEALLTDTDRLLALLGVSTEADLVLVGVEKDGLRVPPGGTLHLRRVGSEPMRLCITELAARTTALDERELNSYATTGRYYPLNAGPLVLRTEGLALALSEWVPPLHVARRAVTVRGGPEPDAPTRVVTGAKPEEFLPEIVEFANDRGLTCKVATCDCLQYGAIKDYAAALRVSRLLRSASRRWLKRRQVPVPTKSEAEVTTGSRVKVAEPARFAGGTALEVDGDVEFGRGVELAGDGRIHLLGRVSLGNDVQIEAAGRVIILGDGPSVLTIGAGARLCCPRVADLPTALVVLDSVPAGTVVDAGRLPVRIEGSTRKLATLCRRTLWEWTGEPVLVACWASGEPTCTLLALGTTIGKALRALPAHRRQRQLWQVRRTFPEAFEALTGRLQEENDWRLSAAIATAELLDRTATDLDLALLDLALRIDELVAASPGVVKAALTGRDHSTVEVAAVRRMLAELRAGRLAPATLLAEMVVAVASDRYHALEAQPEGDPESRRARLVEWARRQSRPVADFLRHPFLPPDQLDPAAVRHLLGSDQMTRSFSGIRAAYGEQSTLSFPHRLIAAIDAYAYIELLVRQRPRDSLRIVLAYDPRPTSNALLDAHVRGLLAAGSAFDVRIEPLNLGLLATPVFEESVRELRADGGIMITASHCPVVQNGSKYAGGVLGADGKSNPLAGALLPPVDMRSLTDRAEMLIERVCVGDQELIRQLNEVEEGAVARALTSHPLCGEQSWQAFARFLQRQLALTDKRALADFRQTAERTQLVLDPNGGSGCKRGAVLLRGFGFRVDEVNDEIGRPMHDIEPGEKAFRDLIPAMRKCKAAVGGVLDWDADRLVWAARDRFKGVSAAESQQVAAFNVALWLSWLHLRGELVGRQTAVVAHGPTSTAVDDIADVFGARVFRVETGEMNVVTRMTQLRREGWLAAVGVEGANGGTIFSEDTCRNGFLTLLVAGMVAANADLVCHWLQLSGRWWKLDESKRIQFVRGRYTLDEVIASLPRYHTKAIGVTADRLPPQRGWQGLLKDRFFQRFLADYWNHPDRRSRCGLTSPDRDYVNVRQTNYEESREVEHRTGDASGGYKIELTDNRGDRSFLWLRFSRTEPSRCRLIVDSKYETETRVLGRAAVNLFRAALADVLAAG